MQNNSVSLSNDFSFFKNSGKYFLVFITIFISVGASILSNNDIVYIVLGTVLGLSYFLNYSAVDKIVRYTGLYMIAITIIAMVRFGAVNTNTLYTLTGGIVRILVAFFLLKLIGKNIFLYMEKVFFTLIIIGIPLFLLDVFFPAFIAPLQYLDLLSVPEQNENGGWYIFVYMHSAWAQNRFCGFAWEPGAMAFIIILGILINFFYYGPRFSQRILVYLSALALTFSTMGYIALGLIVILFSYNKAKQFRALIIPMILLVLVMFYSTIYQYEFFGKKIDTYQENNRENLRYGYENITGYKAGRLGMFFVGSYEISKWPLGHGLTTDGRTKDVFGELVSGANAFMEIFIEWGPIGLGFLIFSIYKLFKSFLDRQQLKGTYLAVGTILLTMMSNPISKNTIIYIVFFYYFVYIKPFQVKESRTVIRQPLNTFNLEK